MLERAKPSLRFGLTARVLVAAIAMAVGIAAGGTDFPRSAVPIATLVLVSVIGGLTADRGRQVLAVAGGVLLVLEGVAVQAVLRGNGPPSDAYVYLSLAGVVGGISLLLATPGFVVRRVVRQPAPRLLAGLVTVIAVLGFVSLFVLHDSPVQPDHYALGDDRSITITVAAIPHSWTRASVTEDADRVRVEARSMWTSLLGGTANLVVVDIVVRLDAPLGARTVVDGEGRPIARQAALRTFDWTSGVLCDASAAVPPVAGELLASGEAGDLAPIRLDDRTEASIVWPRGFAVTLEPDLVLHDEHGQVVARAGDRVALPQVGLWTHAGTLDDPYMASGMVFDGCYPRPAAGSR